MSKSYKLIFYYENKDSTTIEFDSENFNTEWDWSKALTLNFKDKITVINLPKCTTCMITIKEVSNA